MLKALVFDTCEWCEGEAYVYAGEYKDGDVERPVYQACQACRGSGAMEKPISCESLRTCSSYLRCRTK